MNNAFDKSTLDQFLKIPGARKAAGGGILIPQNDGGLLHLTGMHRLPDELKSEETFYMSFCSIKEIIRLRSLRNSQDYLLRVRANAIADSPRAIRVFNARKSKFHEIKKTWSLTYYYHTLDRYYKDYVDLLIAEHQKRLRNVTSGMAFIPEANAICIRSLAGDVVLASESLEQFYKYMTLAVFGQQLQIPIQDRIHSLVLATRIMNGSEALDFDIDPRAQLPITIERKLNKRVRDQLQFTFGHEFAHYLRDHLSSPYASHDSASGEVFETYAHDLEFEADLYAVKHVTTQQDQKRIAYAGLSVMLFLHFLAEANKRFGSKTHTFFSTHPPSIDRAWRLWDSFKGLIEVSQSDMEVALDALTELQDLMALMMKNGRDDILTFYGSIYLPTFRPKPKLDRIDF